MSITADTKSFFFQQGLTVDIPVNVDGVTDALEFCSNYVWFLQPFFTGIGAPTYTLEMSSDGINWKAYKVAATDVDILNALDDTHLSGQFLRIAITSNGATGTVRFKIQLKRP